jgi:hypothetical protein
MDQPWAGFRLTAAPSRAGEVRYHLGMVLSRKGKNKEAAAELNPALALDPKFTGTDEAKKTLESLK